MDEVIPLFTVNRGDDSVDKKYMYRMKRRADSGSYVFFKKKKKKKEMEEGLGRDTDKGGR